MLANSAFQVCLPEHSRKRRRTYSLQGWVQRKRRIRERAGTSRQGNDRTVSGSLPRNGRTSRFPKQESRSWCASRWTLLILPVLYSISCGSTPLRPVRAFGLRLPLIQVTPFAQPSSRVGDRSGFLLPDGFQQKTRVTRALT